MAEFLLEDEEDRIWDICEDDCKHYDTVDDVIKTMTGKKLKNKKYNLFEKDASISSFYTNKNAENILDEIIEKNKKSKQGNIKIPDTSLMLVNFSSCPNCDMIYTMDDLNNYFKKPYIETKNNNIRKIRREDATIMCKCKKRFIPALLLVDSSVQGETQLLCRMQTIDRIEKFYLERGKKVFTLDKKNIITHSDKSLTVKADDISINDFTNESLISNYIQYSTVKEQLAFINDNRVQSVLYGQTFKHNDNYRI